MRPGDPDAEARVRVCRCGVFRVKEEKDEGIQEMPSSRVEPRMLMPLYLWVQRLIFLSRRFLWSPSP